MMPGSLLCFSSDNFETFFFATIFGQQDPEELTKGEFQVKLDIETSSMAELSPHIIFTVIESQVYFEVYYIFCSIVYIILIYYIFCVSKINEITKSNSNIHIYFSIFGCDIYYLHFFIIISNIHFSIWMRCILFPFFHH